MSRLVIDVPLVMILSTFHMNGEVVVSACFSKEVWILNAKIVSGIFPSSRWNSWMFVSRAQR